MEQLDLTKCTNNEEVCALVSERLESISLEELTKIVSTKMLFQESAIKVIYTGLSLNMNVFLSSKGGFGKSTLIKLILNTYKIPYHVVVGYKDMPVDALLGVPNVKKLIEESEYEVYFQKSVFSTPGVLLLEEFTHVSEECAAVLKDILTERGFRSKSGKIESKISSVIVAANKSAKEMARDESSRALYLGRFPLTFDMSWTVFSTRRYYVLLQLLFPDNADKKLFFLAALFNNNYEQYNNPISPRTALEVARVYFNKGISYVKFLDINIDSIDAIQAQADLHYSTASFKATIKELFTTINAADLASRCELALYAKFKLTNVILDNDNQEHYYKAMADLDVLITSTVSLSPVKKKIKYLVDEL